MRYMDTTGSHRVHRELKCRCNPFFFAERATRIKGILAVSHRPIINTGKNFSREKWIPPNVIIMEVKGEF